MKHIISVLLLLACLLNNNAQVLDSLNQKVSPKNGLNQLAIKYYGIDFTKEPNVNIHLGVRYIKLSLKEATGMMVELGFSYRMSLKGIKEHKLKDEFLNK